MKSLSRLLLIANTLAARVFLCLLLLFVSSASYAQVAVWRLNNNATDASGNSINGTLMNSPTFSTTAKEGSHSLVVNGTSQYVDFGNPSNLPSGLSPRTISGWAMTSTTSGARSFFAYGSGTATRAMTIGMNGTSLIGSGWQSDLSVANFWTTGVWHHVCLTYDGTTARLYADGVEVASQAIVWNLLLSKVFIGRSVNNVNYWQGSIDDVRIYNTALSAAQVQALATPVPTSPGGLTATTASATSINLAWSDNSTNETGFQIERSLTSGSGYSLITTTAANAVSYSDASLAAGTTYYYRIRATNAGGSSAYTVEASAVTVGIPAAPSILTATATSPASIDLSWTDNSSNETGFQIERSLTMGSGYNLITTTTANAVSYADAGLTAGTTYYYRIRAVNEGGSSAYTTEATATTTGVPPAAPTALIATATASTSITLSWTDASSNEQGFQIERSITSGSGFSFVSTTVANAVSYADEGINPSTTYFYRVRAINAGSVSAYTAEVSATTPASPPEAPSGLAAAAASGAINLTWTDNSSNEVEFEIERSLTSESDYALLATVEADLVSYSDTSGVPGTTYYYRIRASNGGGYSAYTAELSIILPIEGGTDLCRNIFCADNGGVGIGTQVVPSGYSMAVKGKVMAEGVKVALQSDWPDYVFKEGYALTDIPALKKFITENGHLPNVPTDETIKREGIDIGGINVLLLEKIEELSLYLIQMEERMKALETENDGLKKRRTKR
jgi:hypothetical protein